MTAAPEGTDSTPAVEAALLLTPVGMPEGLAAACAMAPRRTWA